MKVEGNRAVLSFDNVGAGLECRGREADRLHDRRRRTTSSTTAEAEIRGDTVVVSSPDVEKPVAVRVRLGELPGREPVEQGRPAGNAVPHGRLARHDAEGAGPASK